jgi:hypothetical protein
MACHASKEKPAEAKPGAQSMIPGCRVGTKDCASCHMPKIDVSAAHFKFTDHYIRIVKSRETYPN